MSQHHFNENQLILAVKKAPSFIRGTLFICAFIMFLVPLIALISIILYGDGLKISFIIVILIFGFLGFYLLRAALWNTQGKEIITFQTDSIKYVADYGWFKRSEKNLPLDNTTAFTIDIRGYEEDKKGVLVCTTQSESITCATKIHIVELEMIIDSLDRKQLGK